MIFTIITMVIVVILGITIYVSLGGSMTISPKSGVTTFESFKDEESSMIQPNRNDFYAYNYRAGNELKDPSMQTDMVEIIHVPMIVILVVCIFIFSIILFLWYFLKLTKKFSYVMDDIIEGIDEISHGNFEYKIRMHRQDEFGIIADKINQFSEEFKTIMESDKRGEDKKHELITSVAHDLRTPLTSVIGYLELLRSGKVEGSTREHYVEIVYNKAKRLEQLIEDLFSYTKYNYGSVAEIKESVDIVKMLEQLIEEFYPSFSESQLEYEFYKDCSSLVSYADGNLLARAFANLIGNAIKYGVEGKRIEISFTHTYNVMRVEFKNYGLVIPQEDLPHIFDRFYRVESSRSQETGGSGLGLAIAKSIVLMHFGEISASSNLNGTVFEVQLPIMKEPIKN